MQESKKLEEYRDTLHQAAKAGRRAGLAGQARLEGKAAKLSLEIQEEESKGTPGTSVSAKKAVATRKRRTG